MPNFDANDIKKKLKSCGVSQAKIAKMLKVHPVCVHEVVTGKRRNPRIRLAIAMAIGEQVSEIAWPENQSKEAA